MRWTSAITKAKSELLSNSCRSTDDIILALSILDIEDQPFSVEYFDSVLVPVLRYYLHPSRCPNIGDDLSQCSPKFPIFDYCCQFLFSGPLRTPSFVAATRSVWPGFSKYVHYLLELLIQEENTPHCAQIGRVILAVGRLFDSVPDILSRSPEVSVALVHSHFIFVQRQLDQGLTSPLPGAYDTTCMPMRLWSSLLSECCTESSTDPALELALASNAPAIAKAGVSTLAKAVLAPQPDFALICDELRNIHDLATLEFFRYPLFENRILKWCMNIIWLTIKSSRHPTSQSTTLPPDILATITYLPLSYITSAFEYYSMEVLREVLPLNLLEAIIILDPLLFQHDEDMPRDKRDPPGRNSLSVLVKHFFRSLRPFAIYKDVLHPFTDFLTRSRSLSLRWVKGNCMCGCLDEKMTLASIRDVERIYEASIIYGKQGRHICFSPDCADYNYGDIIKEVGRCQECSRCRQATYCSRECQRKDWSIHRQLCTALQESKQRHLEALKSGNPMTTYLSLRVKDVGFIHFLATQILNNNVDVIRARYIANDGVSYMNDNLAITILVHRWGAEALEFEVSEGEPVCNLAERERLVRVAIPFRLSKMLCTCYFGCLTLPYLTKDSTVETLRGIVMTRSVLPSSPLGGWVLDPKLAAE